MLPLNHHFVLVKDPADYAVEAAKTLTGIITSSGTGPCLISLSGGSTPFPVYRKMARMLANSGSGQRYFWMQTDERMVAAGDECSNQRGIKQSLLADGFLPQNAFLPAIIDKPPTEATISGFERLCGDYRDRLQQLPKLIRPPAPIDLLILGVGNDGHTASLFPDTDWQTRNSETGFAVFQTASQPEARLSLTLERIMQARNIVFLVSGAGKRAILQNIFFDSGCSSPAAYIARNRGATWILDHEAAGERLVSLVEMSKGATMP